MEELPAELRLEIFQFLDNETLRSVMMTCKGLNDLLNNSDVFWFQRTVRPATADTDTWEELGRVYDTATGAVVPTINVPHIGLDTSIHKNLAKQNYASRCVRSLFPACPVCSKVNTVFCFWRTCCYDCLKDGFGESLAFELKNVYRDRLMARFMFFLDDVDVYFDDVVPFVLDVDLQEVAIAKYVTFEALYDVASVRHSRWRAMKKELAWRGIIIEKLESEYLLASIESESFNVLEVAQVIEQNEFLSKVTPYPAIASLAREQLQAFLDDTSERYYTMLQNQGYDLATVDTSTLKLVLADAKRAFLNGLKQEAYQLYYLKRHPVRVLQALHELCPLDEPISHIDLEEKFETAFGSHVEFVQVFQDNVYVFVRKHDVGPIPYFFASSSTTFLCRASSPLAIKKLCRSEKATVEFSKHNLVVPEHAWRPAIQQWIQGADIHGITTIIADQVNEWSQAIALINSLMIDAGQPMSIEYIREQLNLALTENELLACLEVHFRSVKEDDLVFYEPLHTRIVVVPMDTVDTDDYYGNADEDDDLSNEDLNIYYPGVHNR